MTTLPMFDAPTPLEVLGDLDYQFALTEHVPVVRIPILGPPPFNTLARVVTICSGNSAVPEAAGHLRHQTVVWPTELVVRGYDPARPEFQHVRHSSTGFVRTMGTESGSRFTIALDEILPQSSFDTSLSQLGRWVIVYHIGFEFSVDAFMGFEIVSWVLFHEDRAAPPRPPDPPGLPTLGSLRLRAKSYATYFARPHADVMKAADELTDLARQLSAIRAADDALAAQRLVVSSLAAFHPPHAAELAYALQLAEARHNLMARLVDVGRLGDARVQARLVLPAYGDYGQRPHADLDRLAGDLRDLAHQVGGLGLEPDLVLTAQQAYVDVLARLHPSPDAATERRFELAAARHTLVVRLLEGHHLGKARAQAGTAIAEYAAYAGMVGASVAQARTGLSDLEGVLSQFGLADLAAACQSAIDGLP